MKSILRATLVLSGSSIVTILAGLVSAKVSAVLLGPSGFGAMGLLLALLGLAGLLAGMGIGGGLIRLGANALAADDQPRVAALYRAAWLLCWSLGALAALILVVFRVPISNWMLGGPEFAASVPLLAIPLLFNLVSTVQTSFLNTYHRLAALVRNGIVNSVVGTAATLTSLWLWREQGVIPAIIAGSVIGWLISSFFLWRERIEPDVGPKAGAVLAATLSLLRFGGPYTASALVSTGVQFVLPAVVLHALAAEDVGFYRAATSISAGYLGFLLLAMAQDYFPRISAAGDRPAELRHLVNQQHQLVMLVAAPAVLATLALAPHLVPVVYSPAFAPAVEVLEWQLVGDLFKFASWTMGFAILARSGSLAVLIIDLVFGVNTILGSLFFLHWFGLPGLGMAALFSYVAHYMIVFMIVRRDINMVFSSLNKMLFLLCISLSSIIVAITVGGLHDIRTPLAVAFALLFGSLSVFVIARDLGGGPVVERLGARWARVPTVSRALRLLPAGDEGDGRVGGAR